MDQAPRRRRACSADGYPKCRPLLGRRRSAKCGVCAVQFPEHLRRAAPRVQRYGPHRLARADGRRLAEGIRLLQRAVRLAEGRRDGYGGNGHLPDLLGGWATDRGHDEEAADGAGPQLALLYQRRRYRRGNRPREDWRRPNSERPDAGARRRLDRPGQGPARRDVRTGREEGLAAFRSARVSLRRGRPNPTRGSALLRLAETGRDDHIIVILALAPNQDNTGAGAYFFLRRRGGV